MQLTEAERHAIASQVTHSLEEDLSAADPTLDITAQLIPAHHVSEATIITREDMVVCGTAWVEEVFRQVDADVAIEWCVTDGDKVQANTTLCHLSGNSRSLLTGERCALNFLQTLSATASQTAFYVSKLAGFNTRLLDTRKTIPGLRMAQKYAVRCGGGTNHRIGLFDAYLIKENHIAACGGIVAAVCHGPAALVNLKRENGKYLIDGVKVAGFTNKEEEIVKLTKEMPFLLEDKLKDRGAIFEAAKPWQEKVVADKRIVTGQNPASASQLGKVVVDLLKK